MSTTPKAYQESNHPNSATETVAEFVVGATISASTLKNATSAVLDTIAVTIGGSIEPSVVRLTNLFEPVVGRAAAPLLWSATILGRADAALVMGTASHVLDYDDVSMLSVCHPSAPVLSALLCARNWDGVSGRSLLEAFVVGTEVTVRLGQSMGFRHYQLGFHATATLGTVGAAAATARLLGFDRDQTRHALSIAASMASGLQANFGTMMKSVHVGLAASNGVKAAQLAAGGIEGAREVFSGCGFVRAFSGGDTTEWPDASRSGGTLAIDKPGFEQKRYPCCYMLHRMAEAALMLRRQHGIVLDDVVSIRVDMPFGGTKPLIHPRPRTGLNALFSAPYTVLACLSDGRLDLESFTDVEVQRDKIQSRIDEVEVVERTLAVPPEAIGDAPVTVRLTLRDGSAREHTITVSPGSREDPMSSEQLRDKWVDCLRRASPSFGDAPFDRYFEDGRRLPEMANVGQWLMSIRSIFTSSRERSPSQ